MHEHILFGLVTLVALGAGAQVLAYHTKLPSILVLLAFGFLAGPIFGFVAPDEILGDVTFPLVSLGAALILFEGGLTAHFEELRAHGSAIGRLVSVGLLLTWVLTALSAFYFLGLSLELAALLGAILVVTGPTVIGPIVRHARPGGSVGRILKFEGIINDPIGAVLALLVFQVIQAERVETAAMLIVWGVLRAALGATAIGLVGAFVYAQAKKRGWIPQTLENAVLLPLVLVVYALSNHVQAEAGLLAVTVMGMVLASHKGLEVEGNVEFAEHLRTMLISVLFVLLTARMTQSDLTALSWGGVAFVAALILVIRPLSVFVSTVGLDLALRERTFLALMAPRGIVAAAVSSVFALRLSEAGYAGSELLLPLTFVVIAACVVFYGLGARPLVRLLHLSDERPQGVLILGDNELCCQLAERIKQSGRKAVLISSDRRRVGKLRRQGYSVEHGRVQSTALLNRLDLEAFGCFLALTPDDDKNALACVHFGRLLGKGRVARVVFAQEKGEAEARLSTGVQVKKLFGGIPYEDALHLMEHGEIKITPLTEQFTFDDLLQHYQGRVMPLLSLEPRHFPRILEGGRDPEPGEHVLSLVWGKEREEGRAA